MCVTRGCKLFCVCNGSSNAAVKLWSRSGMETVSGKELVLVTANFIYITLHLKKININEANSKMILSRMWQFNIPRQKLISTYSFYFVFLKDMPIN